MPEPVQRCRCGHERGNHDFSAHGGPYSGMCLCPACYCEEYRPQRALPAPPERKLLPRQVFRLTSVTAVTHSLLVSYAEALSAFENNLNSGRSAAEHLYGLLIAAQKNLYQHLEALEIRAGITLDRRQIHKRF